MQDLQIECEKCGATLTIVREWPDGWKYRATVEPCPDCMEEAAQPSVQADGAGRYGVFFNPAIGIETPDPFEDDNTPRR